MIKFAKYSKKIKQFLFSVNALIRFYLLDRQALGMRWQGVSHHRGRCGSAAIVVGVGVCMLSIVIQANKCRRKRRGWGDVMSEIISKRAV